MIPIQAGEGPESAASFSRFVLPFAYSPSRLRGRAASGWRYVPCPVDDRVRVRRKYLTVETAHVLFERARWFELRGPVQEEEKFLAPFRVTRRKWGQGGTTFLARLRPPRLALFEWSHSVRYGDGSDEGDLLASGFLIVDVTFPSGEEPSRFDFEDLLAFNELFRYWQAPFPEHDEERGFSTVLKDAPVEPCRPGTRLGCTPCEERYLRRWEALLELPVEDGGRRWRLIPPRWWTQARQWIEGSTDSGTAGWAIYADHRCFTWTAAMVEGGLEGLHRAAAPSPEGKPASCETYGHWAKLLNFDLPGSTGAATHACTEFERERTSEATYRRWEEVGTLYGFVYHGGAMLGAPVPWLPIARHWADIYFDQTLLLLYLRVTLFRFSGQLSRISGESRSDGGGRRSDDWRRRFQGLRRAFALFVNLYEFPLISNQQQGIEMYTLARTQMDVADLFDEVREEVHSTHAFFESEATSRLNRVVTLLAVVAAVTGFFGMNVLIDKRWHSAPSWPPEDSTLWMMAYLLAFLLIASRVFIWLEKHSRTFLEDGWITRRARMVQRAWRRWVKQK